jgi:hypothetical protein
MIKNNYYTATAWEPRTGTDLNKFTDSNSGNTLILSSAATITNPGTPFTADAMNRIEGAITKASWSYGDEEPTALTNPSEGQLYFKIV